jgi:hypothetical protein
MTTQFRIASPCSADWDSMPGDERVRFCPQCKLNVYNFSELSRKEVERLVRQREGRLCARFYQRADGTMLTQDCPGTVREILNWSSRTAAGVLAALVSIAPAFSRPSPQQPGPTSAATQTHPAKKSLSMVFTDPAGGTVPHVKVTLRQESGDKEFTAEGNDAGEVSFSGLPKGTYALTATYPGFRRFHLAEVKVPYAATMHLPLDLGMMGEVVVIEMPDYQPGAIHRFLLDVKHFF